MDRDQKELQDKWQDLPIEPVPVIEYPNRDTSNVDEKIVDKAYSVFHENGGLVIKDCYSEGLIKDLHTEFFNNYEDYIKDIEGNSTVVVGDKRHMLTIRAKESFALPEFLAPPRLEGFLNRILGEDHILASMTGVVSGRGARVQQ